jgi:hypothetical protein
MGSGKSSLLDVLLFLRQFVTRGDTLDSFPVLLQRTRWLDKSQLIFELEATLASGQYLYRLIVEPWGEPPRARVFSETLHLNGRSIFEFVAGEVRLYNDSLEHKVTYPFDWHRSGLETIMPRKDNQKLTQFKNWVTSLYCFRLNPFNMSARAEREDFSPNVDFQT